MTEAQGRELVERAWSLRAVDVVGSIVGLATLAIAQPLLDLVGRDATFLVAHGATAGDVIAIAVAVAIVIPLLLAGLVLLTRLLSPAAATVVHALLLGVLGVVLLLVVARLSGVADRLPGFATVAIAVVLGLVVPVTYALSAAARRLTIVAAVAAPVVAALFVFASPARALVVGRPLAGGAQGLGPDSPSVVFVVFDELPLASLLTRDQRIDAAAFPAFGRLAADATWFRSTTTVAGQTSDALPALLAGEYPEPATLPIAADYPHNLFTLLSQDYDMHVLEPITGLCPPAVCEPPADEQAAQTGDLIADLAIVGSHLVLPPDLATSLPPIDQGWRDFRAAVDERGETVAVHQRFNEARASHPGETFEDFIAGVQSRNRPTLHFAHVLLPHSPWRYAADGRPYDATVQRPGLKAEHWFSDPWPVAQGYQRHLVQLQLADRLLGELLDRLRTLGEYDDTAVVVVSDHGASVTPDSPRRAVTRETFDEIGAVPLIVKSPGQSGGTISDRPVEVVDVLPTVLDVIGAEVPAGVDGVSALDGRAPERTVRRFWTTGETLEFPPTIHGLAEVVERKHRLFGQSDALPFPFGLAPEGTGHLLGMQAPLDAAPAPLLASLENADLYADFDPDAPTVPAVVSGFLAGPTVPRPLLAVAVNGRVMAVTMGDEPEPNGGGRWFRALVPPDALRKGRNVIQLYLVDDGRLRSVPLTHGG